MRATAIIPAYNEAARVGSVLRVVADCPLVDEIIVVDDGSSDTTAEVVSSHEAVTLCSLPCNCGKAVAMFAGATQAGNEIVLFLDADLVGLTQQHVEDLLTPVLSGESDMTVGQFWDGLSSVTCWMRWFPAISGQRAMRRAHFLAVPDLASSGYGVELAITRHALRQELRVDYIHLPNISHVVKEAKRGLFPGLAGRFVMYGQMLRCVLGDAGYQLRQALDEIVRS